MDDVAFHGEILRQRNEEALRRAEGARKAGFAGRAGRGRADDVEFKKLWAALSVSLIGSQITIFALPLLAATRLGASPLQMGILAASGQLPFLLLSLPAGVWIDRVRRRPVLITSDVLSGCFLLSIPLSLPFGGPTFPLLCVVAFAVGALTVVSELAHYAYVPSLVGRSALTRFNSRLQVSYSAADAAGPGLSGVLIQIASAPLAVVVDALSFFVSGHLVRTIRHVEPRPSETTASERSSRLIAEGILHLTRHPLLRPLVFGGAAAAVFESGFLAIYILFASRELNLNPAAIGGIFAAGGVAAIPGALVADRVARLCGVGPTIICGWGVLGVVALVPPLVSGSVLGVVLALAAANAVGALAFTVMNIHQWTLRQTVTPDRLAGRVTASHRFIVYGAGAVGALVGGALGSTLGLRPALFVCAFGMLLGPLVAFASPLRRLRTYPASE